MNTPPARSDGRTPDQLRPISITRHYQRHAEGSVLICCGDTHVICSASISNSVPPFLKGKGQGWLTAEYGMLPRSTSTRMDREAARGKQSGRTQEIQRLIGRSLRAAIDLTQLGERTIHIDCDVIQADGGTRTASITGAYIALHDAVQHLLDAQQLAQSPLQIQVAAISVGIVNGVPVLDMNYEEDAHCDTDMNVVMTGQGKLIEIQGTAEGNAFSRQEMHQLLDLAEQGIQQLIGLQRQSQEKP